MKRVSTGLLVSLTFLLSCGEPPSREADVVIVGGGASGVSAAIQAARMEMDVILVEETDWLGGMLTAAGVSATDGNHQMPSGFWGEFRQALYDHYGGPSAVATGWVSHTLFEPHVGHKILQELISEYENITLLKRHSLHSAITVENKLREIIVEDSKGNELSLKAGIFIEATEYGDLLAAAGVPYSRTMETFDHTRELGAPTEPHPYVQDLTYVAILQEHPVGEDHTIPKPEPYEFSDFECMCNEVCKTPTPGLISCQSMLDYGKLPNGKYMINWPNKGNDTYLEILEKTPEQREVLLEEAKNMTLSWIYFLQTEGGFRHIGLAKDEFGTEDHLAIIPYIRESRRVEGVDRLYLYDIQDPYQFSNRPLFKTAIAVADYPVDHHRKKNPIPKQIEFPKIPSYSVPFGSLVPEQLDGLLVAEKSISVSNVVNGTTRLQPVVLQIGQVAGAAAALSIIHETDPRNLDVRKLQESLLDAGLWLMPYMDTNPQEATFKAVQRVGLTGLMRGTGIPVAWANETRFYPDSTVMNYSEILNRLPINEIEDILKSLRLSELTSRRTDQVKQDLITLKEAITFVHPDLNIFRQTSGIASGDQSGSDTSAERNSDWITRDELAVLLDQTFDLFALDPVSIGFRNPVLE